MTSMLIVSVCLNNIWALGSALLALWIIIVPKSEVIIVSVFVSILLDSLRFWYHQKEKKSVSFLLPLPIIIVISTLVFAFIAILFGAPLLSDTENTLLFGLLLSVLTIFPTALASGGSVTKLIDTLVDFVAESSHQQQDLGAAAGAVAGAWFGALVIPLDWDRPWQVWPVSCCAGAHLGSAVGRLLSCRLCPAANVKSE